MQDSDKHHEPPDPLPLEEVLSNYERPHQAIEACNRVRRQVFQNYRPGLRTPRRRRRVLIFAAAAAVALAVLLPGIRNERRRHVSEPIGEVTHWSNFEMLAGLDRDIARIDGNINKLRQHGLWGNNPFEDLTPLEESQ